MSDSETIIYILQWANKCERWSGVVHTIDLFSTFEKAEEAAKIIDELEFGFTGSPWILIDRGEWICSRDNANYEMWISEEKVK